MSILIQLKSIGKPPSPGDLNRLVTDGISRSLEFVLYHILYHNMLCLCSRFVLKKEASIVDKEKWICYAGQVRRELSVEVKVIRSTRRKKTVEARLESGTLVVRAPAAISEADLRPIIDKFKAKLNKKLQRQQRKGDNTLETRAQHLNRRYFKGRLSWGSIRYVTNQHKRFGSCTPSYGTIRISQRVARMPDWVRDYVIVHELAHLIEPNHSRAFWKLVNRYPKAERARGYLMAIGMEADEEGEQPTDSVTS
jgi:predicted metal-dependent hydrolase